MTDVSRRPAMSQQERWIKAVETSWWPVIDQSSQKVSLSPVKSALFLKRPLHPTESTLIQHLPLIKRSSVLTLCVHLFELGFTCVWGWWEFRRRQCERPAVTACRQFTGRSGLTERPGWVGVCFQRCFRLVHTNTASSSKRGLRCFCLTQKVMKCCYERSSGFPREQNDFMLLLSSK